MSQEPQGFGRKLSKKVLHYKSAVGKGGDLEIGLNFMFRIPLWPVAARDSRPVGSFQVRNIPVLDIHEIAGGKLAALFARHAARDLFDTRQLLARGDLNRDRLRLAFILYGAMNPKDWRTVSVDDLKFDAGEIENQLLPLLKKEVALRIGRPTEWAKRLFEECRDFFKIILPFSERELEFLDRLLDHGEIEPSLLTSDEEMTERIKKHPSIEWKAMNVRQYKKK